MDLEKLSFNGIGHEKFVDSVQTVCQFISGVTNTPPPEQMNIDWD